MSWRFGIASDIGGRDEQQDRVELIASQSGDDHLVVVADGMGGYHGGALAAQAVVDSAERFFVTASKADPLASLGEICTHAHQAVVNVGEQDSQPPGSTCVLVYLSADEACWAHVGDSRLYHFRNGKILTRTLDHSMVQLLVSQGKMTEDEMATSPLQNQLTMRLGGEQQPNPELGAAEVQKGDIFMLCSDGFWESVNPEEAIAIASKNDLKTAAERLVQLAKERGGDGGDNITVALTQLGRVRRWFHLFS